MKVNKQGRCKLKTSAMILLMNEASYITSSLVEYKGTLKRDSSRSWATVVYAERESG